MMNKDVRKHIPAAIAIIGMGCFFPKAPGLKRYWHLLFKGIDAIVDVPDTHWSPNDYFDENPKTADHVYCTRGGFLSPVDFDPMEFGIPPTSLEATDTSQLLGLICAKAALTDAGYADRDFNRDRTSVILGVTGTQELVIPLSSRLGHPIWRKALRDSGIPSQKTEEIVRKISDAYVPWQENSFPGLLGNVVAGRIANRLDLGGTNCVVDAACASSLSAVHLALMELTAHRSDMVITGGVDTLNDIFMHMCFSKTGVLSPSGNAKPFSSQADGTVLGEGVGLIVLKRLEDAEQDHDRIYAVIRGLGASSDGKSQSIYAPRIEGQVRAMQQAYRDADVDPKTISLFEAHGTGTRVGDRVEFAALRQVVGHPENGSGRHAAVGSVKSMIGHTKAAAGVAGLIKSTLALYHKVLPPTLKVDEPDPELGIEESPFYLNTDARPWMIRNGHPRRSGVSAFGFGGSNFHAVLEEYRSEKTEVSWEGSVEIFAVSGESRQAVKEGLEDVEKEILEGKPSAWVANRSRQNFSATAKHRLLLRLDLTRTPDISSAVSSLLKEASRLLSTDKSDLKAIGPRVYYCTGQKSEPIAFMFPGQGGQYAGMGKELVSLFPEALDIFEKADKVYDGKQRLSEYVYPVPVYPENEPGFKNFRLQSTDIAQPAIAAVNLSLMRILERFGIRPDAVCGHSFGELTAMCAAGWIDVDTALELAVYRGKFMATSGGGFDGAMLAVSAPLEQLESIAGEIRPEVVLSNRNSPTQGVLSGTAEGVEAADEKCRRLGFKTKRLPVSTAFHTRYMASAQASFAELLKKKRMIPTDVPVLSNRTGAVYPKDADRAKLLLSEQLVHPVDFIGNVKTLYDMGIRTFLEVGPGSILTGLIKSALSETVIDAFPVDASSGKGSGLSDLAGVLCRLAALGYPVDLTRWEDSVSEPVRQRMPILLHGSNFRSHRDGDGSENRVQSDDQSAANGIVAENIYESTGTGTEASDRHKHHTKNHENRAPMKRDPEYPDIITDALRVAKEGLKSMQAIQLQTAETHKKFLETQAEAARTLREMMQSTRSLTRMLSGDTSPHPPERDVPPPENGIRSGYPAESFVPEPDVEPENIQTGSTRSESENTPSPVHIEKNDPDRDHPDPSGETVEPILLGVVSRLTGYPVDMLEMDMDIEADLGIDSIKRVEILSTLEETLPGLPKVSPEMMGTLKTLGQIADYLAETTPPALSTPIAAAHPAVISGPVKEDIAARHIVVAEETPFRPGETIRVPKGRIVYVTRDGSGLSEAVTEAFNRRGISATQIRSDDETDWSRSGAAGLIILADTDVFTAFGLANAAGSRLMASGSASGAVFATLTRMDGRFGFGGKGFKNPDPGGLAGLAKTARIEWPQVVCRAFDIDPEWSDLGAIAETVVNELLHPDARHPMEVGLGENIRFTLRLEPTACPDGSVDLKPGDLVVVTGGARGITAAASIALAQEYHPTFLLLGRSPQPVSEPDWLVGITGEADMKRAILSNEFAGATPTPLALEKAFCRYAANRDISSNLEKITRAGSTVFYRAADIRNRSAVEETLVSVRSDHGPIRAIIHGAGILNDRWIVDKTMDQFRSVFDTKVDGLKNLLGATRNDPLRYLILFSSVAARLGNKGQADYAMANEVLNKMATSEASVRPDCKIVSINWGPWDGGMVSDGLKKEFIKNGIPLIPIDAGTRAMLDEMKGKPGGPTEVVIGATSLAGEDESVSKRVPTIVQPVSLSETRKDFLLSFKREIDVDRYPVLQSHVLDGKPVVPFALIAEWLGNSALHRHPGLILHGFDDLRLLNGIRMDVGKRNIRLFAGKLTRQGEQFEVDVELRDGMRGNREVIHSTAKAILSEFLSPAPPFKKEMKTEPYGRSIDEVYEKILFHGERLRGIETVSTLTPRGMIARILPAPAPSIWMKDPIRSRWVVDPLLLDAVFQMATLWCYEEAGNASLPSFCAAYRQYCESFPPYGITAVLEIRSVNDRKMTADITLLNADDSVLARLDGYEAIMDPDLIKAFRTG